MPDAMTHPTLHELVAFSLGKLPEHTAAAVAAHLESCPVCRKAVANVPPDSFLGKVRAAGSDGSSFPPGLAGLGNAPSSAGRPAMPAPVCPNLPPELLNHPKYRILRELGRGGMGVVYQARQTGMMDRPVVIKVINRSLLDNPDALERFRREVQAAAQLSHPNIVTAYDAEQAGELHMLVMEFVPGQNLAEVVQKRGPLPVEFACHFARQVALGLQHAHERKMVHRDIKPHNLMLTLKNQVKILDFGLTKVTSERGTGTGLTSQNAYMGTPDYCAPEQATDARSADIRADLYSLGCTLYCLLAGRPPFHEDTVVKTILAHLQKQPQPLPELRAEVPVELWGVVARLLAKEPGQRYQKPLEVAQALVPFIKSGAKSEAKVSSTPAVESPGKATRIAADASQIRKVLREVPGKTPPKEMPVKEEALPFADLTNASAADRAKPSLAARWKRPGVLAAAVGVFLALILMAGIIIKVKLQPPKSKPGEPPPAEAIVVLEIDQPGAEVLVDGQKIIVNVPGDNEPIEIKVEPGQHKLRISKAGFEAVTQDIKLRAGKSAPIKVHLDLVKVADGKAPKPAIAPAPSAAQESSVVLILRGHEAKVKYLLFTPDGSRLVSASSSYREWDAGGFKHHDPGRDISVRIWSVASGGQIRKFLMKDSQGFDVQGMSVSPDGRLVAACTSWAWTAANGTTCPRVYVWDVASATRKYYLAPTGLHPMRAVGFSSDGTTLFTLRGGTPLHSWSLADGVERGKIHLKNQNPRETPLGTAMTPDCRYVVGGTWDKGVRLWDRETGREIGTFRGHAKVPTGITLAPDGKHILSCAEDFSVRMWAKESGRQVLCLDNLDSNVLCVAFSPDGKWFLTGGDDGIVRLRDTATGKERASFTGHTAKVNCVAFSPNGKFASSGSDDKTIHIWRLPIPK